MGANSSQIKANSSQRAANSSQSEANQIKSDRYAGFGNTTLTSSDLSRQFNAESTDNTTSWENMPISEESSESIFKQYIDIFSNIKKKQIHLNIIIMGKSGHGKSTLINAVFRDNLVREGIGKPVTQNIDEISKKDIPLTIFDTPGFELNTSQQNKLKSDVQNLILQRFQKNDQNQAIHCIWYCISTELGRLEKYEIDYISSFKEFASKFQIPVIVILTKSHDDNEKREMLNCVRTNLRGINVVPVLAKDIVN